MKLYRLTEVSPDGECEVLLGWYEKEKDAYEEARSLRLKGFEVDAFTFSAKELVGIFTRYRVFD